MESKLYRHYKNDKKYKIVDKCLIQINKEWVDAVIYCWEGGEQKFCREVNEFNLKFKEVK